MGDSTQWWDYVQRNLDAEGWNTMDFEKHSGINRTRLVAWRNGGTVSIDNARAVAEAFGDPILTVLVAAGLLTPEEAKQRAVAPVDTSTLSVDQLIAELRRRMESTAEIHRPTAEEVAAHPERYSGIPSTQKGEPQRKQRRRVT